MYKLPFPKTKIIVLGDWTIKYLNKVHYWWLLLANWLLVAGNNVIKLIFYVMEMKFVTITQGQLRGLNNKSDMLANE